jgi:hypothetical protein
VTSGADEAAVDHVRFTLCDLPLPFGLWSANSVEASVSTASDTADVLQLLTACSPVRLEHTAANVCAVDDTAMVTLKQWYKAAADTPSSAFFFSLPAGAAVHALEVTVVPAGGIDGARCVAARIMKKSRAHKAYDAAVLDGRGAYMLENAK